MGEREGPPHKWKPGQSGNPGGRAKLPEELKAKGPDAWKKIVTLMETSADEKVALKAAIWIAERIYGKAAQSIEVNAGVTTNKAIARIAAGESVGDVLRSMADEQDLETP